jgi:ferredoxin-NADP reductase/MOSC domain-containing protein YiiM/ferredoxin
MPHLLSVNVGLPRDIVWRGETVHTAIWKAAVHGRRIVRRLNIDGDGQGDLGGHGGEQRAVFVYQMASYHYWEQHLGRTDFVFGQFGENFTVDGLADDDVCIGDQYRIGSALFEVTQPRVTCYRVGIRMNEPRMAALLVAHKRPGFYFRVLQEGEVGAGDAIMKVADGPEHLTVAEVDGLLYLPHPDPALIERALRISALSPGWQTSFVALLDQVRVGASTQGNAGLVASSSPPPAWPGFRSMRVAHIEHESRSIISLVLKPVDKQPLAVPLPGQYVVLRLRPEPDAPALLRSYSLSDMPTSDQYRVSVKRESNGVAGTYLHTQVHLGKHLEVSAPRGTFMYQARGHPVVLLSAGIGVTPVLAMLHSMAREAPQQEVWWIYGAHNRAEHPFALEARRLLALLPHSHSHICYSQPGSQDQQGRDYDGPGHLSVPALVELGVPRDADYYLCGPTGFLHDLSTGLDDWGIARNRIHMEVFGPEPAIRPGVIGMPSRSPHVPNSPHPTGPAVVFARSGLTVPWDPTYRSVLELAEACDVPVKWSCRTGVCHTCETGLVAGAVQYDPEPLEPPADGNVLICCSHPRSELLLDL